MPKKRSRMGLQMSGWLYQWCVFILCCEVPHPKTTCVKPMCPNHMCQTPWVRIWPWLTWMSGVRPSCRLTCWLSWGRIHLLSALVCGREQTSVPHGLKDRRPQLLPVGVSTGSSQHGRFLHQNGSVRRARGGGEGGRPRKRGVGGEKVNLL